MYICYVYENLFHKVDYHTRHSEPEKSSPNFTGILLIPNSLVTYSYQEGFLALKKVFVWYIKDSKNWLLAVNSSSLMISNVLPLAQGCLQGAGLQNFQALQLLLIPSSPTRFSGSLYSDPTSSSVQQSASLCSHRWPGIPAQRFELEKSVCMHTRRAVRPCLRVCTQMDAHVHTDRQTLTQAHRCAVSKSMSRICFLLSLYASHEMKQESREE